MTLHLGPIIQGLPLRRNLIQSEKLLPRFFHGPWSFKFPPRWFLFLVFALECLKLAIFRFTILSHEGQLPYTPAFNWLHGLFWLSPPRVTIPGRRVLIAVADELKSGSSLGFRALALNILRKNAMKSKSFVFISEDRLNIAYGWTRKEKIIKSWRIFLARSTIRWKPI